MAMERGTAPEMKEAGEHLAVGHAGLDEPCRKIAPELGITLDDQASPQQQQFVATADTATGNEFDSTAVTLMRVTHGQIFPTIAKIRARTRNTLVRQLADLANGTVLDHITVLEKTGLVNHEQVNYQQTNRRNSPRRRSPRGHPARGPAGSPGGRPQPTKVSTQPRGYDSGSSVTGTTGSPPAALNAVNAVNASMSAPRCRGASRSTIVASSVRRRAASRATAAPARAIECLIQQP